MVTESIISKFTFSTIYHIDKNSLIIHNVHFTVRNDKIRFPESHIYVVRN